MDDLVWRAGPLRNRWDVVAESGVVHLVDQDAEESGGLFVWVGLELGIDFDDEGRSHSREQTGLMFKLARVRQGARRTDKYQRSIQVFVVLAYELSVIILRFLAIYFIEPCTVILCGWR